MDVEVVSDIGTLNKKMNEIDRNINIKVICGPKFADRQYKKVNIEPRIIDIFIFYNQESE